MGFIIHVDVLGWVMREAQLPSRLGPICKSKKGIDQAFQVSTPGMVESCGYGQGSPRCPSLAHRVTPLLRHRAFHVSGLRLLGE